MTVNISIEDALALGRALFSDREDVALIARYRYVAIADAASGEILISSHDATLQYARIEDSDDAMLALWKVLLTTAVLRLRESVLRGPIVSDSEVE